MTVAVEPVRDVTDEVVADLNGLVAQLSSSARALDREVLTRIVECPTNTLLVARSDAAIAGMLTLVVFPIPSGVRAWLEDVVVDDAKRSRGLGAALTREAVRLARAAGARSVDLTSRPSRGAANRLYERLGFQVRESQVFRLDVDST